MSEEKKLERPEPGSYPTFTSRKKASTKCFQKPAYGLDEFKSRKLMYEKVSVTLQDGVEFDAFRECLGDPDTVPADKRFPGNPYFLKLVKDGYLKGGVMVKLHPADLQKFLESNAGEEANSNSIILWKQRKRSAKEVELETVIEGHKSLNKVQAAELKRMKALLAQHKIPFDAKVKEPEAP